MAIITPKEEAMKKLIRDLQSKLLDVAKAMDELRAEHGAIIEFGFDGSSGKQQLTTFKVLVPMDLTKLTS